MNGRVYDPELGRFLSPDPFVQFPESTQGYNRYAYVANNPLSYNDPSGHFLHIIVAAYLQAQGYQMAALMVASVGGAVQGYIQSGSAGATKGFVFGIAGGVIANGIGGKFGHEIGYSHANFIPKLLSQGIAQGALSRAGGGRFSDGFLGAAAAEAAGPWLGQLPKGPVQAVAAAIIGGTASVLGGGKFANGAISAAFTNIFNQQALSEREQRVTDLRNAYLALSPEEQGALKQALKANHAEIFAEQERGEHKAERIARDAPKQALRDVLLRTIRGLPQSPALTAFNAFAGSTIGAYWDDMGKLSAYQRGQASYRTWSEGDIVASMIASTGWKHMNFKWGPWDVDGNMNLSVDMYYWITGQVADRPATCAISNSCR